MHSPVPRGDTPGALILEHTARVAPPQLNLLDPPLARGLIDEEDVHSYDMIRFNVT